MMLGGGLLGLGWSRRKVLSHRRSLRALALVVGFAGAAFFGSTAKAVQLAYDPFERRHGRPITHDGPIAGQNPTIGPANPSFFSGRWNLQGITSARPGPTVIPTSLSYKGSPSVGGSITSSDPGDWHRLRTRRAVLNGTGNPTQALWDATQNGTYYMGFEINFGTVGGDGAWDITRLRFFPIGVSPGENRNWRHWLQPVRQLDWAPLRQAAATAKMQLPGT